MWRRRVWNAAKDVVHVLAFLVFPAAGIGVDHTWDDVKKGEPFWFVVWIVGGVAAGLLLVLREVSVRRALSQKVRTDVVRKLLATLATVFKEDDPNVRTNVMLVSPNGKRRKVQSETAHNMTQDPDDGLEIDFGAGVSGRAARERKAAFGDLRYSPAPGHPDWGLTPAEQARIRTSLQSIASVPIFNPDDPRGEILGTLQVDSDQPMNMIFANIPKVEYVATTFADAVALLLKDGG